MPQSEGIIVSSVSVWDVVMMGRYGSMNPCIPRSSDRGRAGCAAAGRLLDLRHRPIGTLSGGQRKHAFLARAIAQRADVLLLG